MIDEKKLQQIAESSAMIVGGYAYTLIPDGDIRVLALHGDNHACVINEKGEVLETNMDDIELAIVVKYWLRNKHLLKEEVSYA